MKDNGKGGKMNKKQKAFVDEYILNGFDPSAAYIKVYKNDAPHTRKSAYIVLNKPYVKEYIDIQMAKVNKKYDLDKHKMIVSLLKTKEAFDDLYELAKKDEPSKLEKDKIRRLSSLLKASDVNKVNDMLNKLGGFYEPEKVEVKTEWNIGFTDFDMDEEGEDDEE